MTGSRFQVDAQRALLQAESKEPVCREKEEKSNQTSQQAPPSSTRSTGQRPKAKVKAKEEGKERKRKGRRRKGCVYTRQEGEGAELGEQQRGFRSSVGGKIS